MLALSLAVDGREVEVTFVGDLTKTDHDVSGKVYILDQNTLVIDEFSYDGNGFGVYINVATRGKNLKAFAKNRIDIPYPSGSEVNITTFSIGWTDLTPLLGTANRGQV